jgi:hypothetical protein
MIRKATPEAWRNEVKEAEVEVVTLVGDVDRSYRAGWCTYANDFNDLPEVEFFCGGINTKTPTAAGLWRQGHLLHFGFEQSPAEMNETGRNLLLNSIAYIARFTDDRPIAITPSVFAGPVPPALRYPEGIVTREDRELKSLSNFVSAAEIRHLQGEERKEYAAWFDDARDFLRPGVSGKLEIDDEAKALGARLGKPAFFEKTRAALKAGGVDSQRAFAVLGRYLPDGPGDKASAEEWRTWLRENEPYLFFSDAGGYRYYIDPLAKKRGIPSAKLRGAERASKP